jgi:hypothetical protein
MAGRGAGEVGGEAEGVTWANLSTIFSGQANATLKN